MDVNKDKKVDHVQLVIEASHMGSFIRQGNWDGAFYRYSSDPESGWRYFGAKIQEAVYLDGS